MILTFVGGLAAILFLVGMGHLRERAPSNSPIVAGDVSAIQPEGIEQALQEVAAKAALHDGNTLDPQTLSFHGVWVCGEVVHDHPVERYAFAFTPDQPIKYGRAGTVYLTCS